jgi:hypothetical protein
MVVHHILCIKFKSSVTEDQIKLLSAGLDSLAQIEGGTSTLSINH